MVIWLRKVKIKTYLLCEIDLSLMNLIVISYASETYLLCKELVNSPIYKGFDGVAKLNIFKIYKIFKCELARFKVRAIRKLN